MSIRKRNEFLDLPSDEEDSEAGYDSEEVENSRLARSTKRRKTAPREEDDEDEDNDDIKDSDEGLDEDLSQDGDNSSDPFSNDSDVADPNNNTTTTPKRKRKPIQSKVDPTLATTTTTSLSTLAKRAATAQSKSLKTGVCYLSRIPPFLKPSALRSLLTPYAPHGINRLFLTPEDPVHHRQRVKLGGNKKKQFTDGWVEFHSKRDAKVVAETLNAHIIGGKKGGWYHDDVWNIKYLKGFKWRHLTEQINAENAERAARMRVEIARTTRENKAFMANVERARKSEGIKETRRKRGDVGGDEDMVTAASREKNEGEGDVESTTTKTKKRPQTFSFRQNEVKGRLAKTAKDQPEEVKRVLSKIF